MIGHPPHRADIFLSGRRLEVFKFDKLLEFCDRRVISIQRGQRMSSNPYEPELFTTPRSGLVQPCAGANPGWRRGLQSVRPVRRVAELLKRQRRRRGIFVEKKQNESTSS